MCSNPAKLVEKYNIKSALIYECDENISLRTATDYIRRLLTVSVHFDNLSY